MHKCAQRMSASRSLTSAAFHSGVSAIAEMTSPQTPIPAADLAVRSRTLDATTAMNMLSSPEFMSPVYRSRAVVDAEEDLAAEEAEEELRSAALRNVIEQQVTSGASTRPAPARRCPARQQHRGAVEPRRRTQAA